MMRQCHAELVPEKQGHHCGADPLPGTWCLDLGSASAGSWHNPARTGTQPIIFPSSPCSTGLLTRAVRMSLVRTLSKLPALHMATRHIYGP